jgi:NAD(P)-dependent dehydrogenase (short-subunit alcohol dehydrogenase family)
VRFTKNVVIVAGGTGGLGRAVSVAFLQEQARVLVTYRNEEEFVALRAAARPNESLLKGYRTDVTDEAAIQKLMDGVLAEYGQVDVMVNTAGAYAGGAKLWDAETGV